MKKMNNKGFTLIEMIVAIAVLAIVSTVTIVSVFSSFQKSKDKAEEAFKKQIEGYVYDYIAMYGSKLDFKDVGAFEKCYLNESDCEDIILKEAKLADNPEMNIDFITNAFANQKLINPNTKQECNKENNTLTIYRDTDFVYCFTIKPINTESCLNPISDSNEDLKNATISTCEEVYKEESGNYKSFKD